MNRPGGGGGGGGHATGSQAYGDSGFNAAGLGQPAAGVLAGDAAAAAGCLVRGGRAAVGAPPSIRARLPVLQMTTGPAASATDAALAGVAPNVPGPARAPVIPRKTSADGVKKTAKRAR